MESYEVNFDGLVGPSHNFSGLAYGNLPSMKNKDYISNPKEAALQCLQKIHYLSDFGLIQGVFPPQERPHLPTLRALGFTGKDEEVISKAYKTSPDLFFNCSSSASMWAANSATVTPSEDSEDGKVHITPANLITEFHRSIETQNTALVLKKIFHNPLYFKHHEPLPASLVFADEGAANHLRFFKEPGDLGLHVFVYGRSVYQKSTLTPGRYPARQTLEASQALSRNHKIFQNRLLFLQQSPKAIDLGVFHNDVISTSNRLFFLYHESAFLGSASALKELNEKAEKIFDEPLLCYEVKEEEVSLKEAVETYLFNSQIIQKEKESMVLIAPIECQKNTRVRAFLEKLTQDPATPIKEVAYVNVNESMLNGGGPACLRLRVPLKRIEVDELFPNVLFSQKLYIRLLDWIHKHYRDRLSPKDLVDPKFIQENQKALDEVTKILGLGSIYSFQK